MTFVVDSVYSSAKAALRTRTPQSQLSSSEPSSINSISLSYLIENCINKVVTLYLLFYLSSTLAREIEFNSTHQNPKSMMSHLGHRSSKKTATSSGMEFFFSRSRMKRASSEWHVHTRMNPVSRRASSLEPVACGRALLWQASQLSTLALER